MKIRRREEPPVPAVPRKRRWFIGRRAAEERMIAEWDDFMESVHEVTGKDRGNGPQDNQGR